MKFNMLSHHIDLFAFNANWNSYRNISFNDNIGSSEFHFFLENNYVDCLQRKYSRMKKKKYCSRHHAMQLSIGLGWEKNQPNANFIILYLLFHYNELAQALLDNHERENTMKLDLNKEMMTFLCVHIIDVVFNRIR